MKINIVCVGALKDKYYKEACAEYLKRLNKFARVSVIETAEEAINKNPSQNRINEILSREAEDFKKHLKGYVVVLDLQGEKTSSIGFSEILKNLMNGGVSEISFLIGSSYGISQEIRELADKRISFSDMTFPHGLFRVMLLEQIYRAFTIQNNITYHK